MAASSLPSAGGLHVLQVMSCRGWSSDAYWAGRITHELGARGHMMTFVARAGTETKVLSRLRDLGVARPLTLRFAGRTAPVAVIRDVREIGRLMAAHDIVHVHRGKEHWLVALAARVSRTAVAVVRTRHIVTPVAAHPLNRWLYRRATDHVVAVSEAIRRQYLDRRLLSPTAVTALPGGVDHRRFHPDVDGDVFRRAHGISPGTPVIGVLAGLRAMKGHGVLLRAARQVLSRRPDARVVLVGEGREERAIRALIEELGLTEVVIVTGSTQAPERAVAAFDIAVYPSRWSDGMSRVLFEYMATGRPIVATATGLAPEVLAHGDSALIVRPDDPDGLAAAIGRLLEDRALAARAAAAARALVEDRFSGAAVAAALENIYRRAIDARAASADDHRRAATGT